MKRAPGTGGIRKLSGKRRKRFQAVVSVGREWRNGRVVNVQKSLGVFATRREAQAELDNYLRFNYNLDLRSIKFREVYDIIRKDFPDSVKNVMSFAYNSCSYLHEKRLIDIKKMDLDIVAQQNEHLAAGSQRKITSLINRIYRFGMENDIVVKSYPLEFKQSRKMDKKTSYSFEEIQTVLKYGTEVQIILLYTGMRISELIELKSEDVYREDGILCFHITKSKTASGIRTIPVHSKIERILKLDEEYVIYPHLTYGSQKRIHDDWNRKHEMSRAFHELRHTFSTYGKKCGMDDFYRKALMGHAQTGITDAVYTDALIPDLKRQIELLDYSKM